MANAQRPDHSVEEPGFRVPFSDADRSLLTERAPQFTELLEIVQDVRERSASHRSLGGRETLAAIRSLEVAGRLVEALSTDLLAHYQRVGDSAAHGYRTIEGLLEGEFRISNREARRRTDLSEQLAARVTAVGEAQDPARPSIAENFADGRISADEANALCKAVDDLPPTVRSLYSAKVERTLVELAPTVRLKDFSKLCQRIVQHIDPDGRLPRFETNPLAYTVTLTQQRNGDWRLRGLLDCPTGTTLRALLYGRMKDADIPVSVRPHRACNAEAPADPNQHGPDPCDTSGPLPEEAPEYSEPSLPTGDEQAIPPIPREAVWDSTRVTVHADATIELEGRAGTFLEDEPSFYLDSRGWPVLLSERVSEEVQNLLEQARSSDSGTASTVIWEKILGRAPAEHALAEPSTGTAPPKDAEPPPRGSSAPPTTGCEPPGSTPETPETRDIPDAPSTPSTPAEADVRPVSAAHSGGVFADGSPHPVVFPEDETSTPGLARHDRFAFLLRSVARERVLHGADHALVVSARPDDLIQPDNVISTHAGSPLSLRRLGTWSNAAQMFVHVVDGGGRTIEVRSQGRFATRSQMAVLAARDQGCTFPDCDAPAEWCEAHHILAFAQGGATEIDNLTLVCPFHHRWFERSGWESVFLRGLPAWVPPISVDPRQRALFHSRFRVALLNLPAELPLEL